MTEYISNIAVKTDTLKPNGAIIGTLTNDNGVLSGFGTHDFFEIPNGRKENATYVVKFTTPSTAPTSTKNILHIDSWDCFEQTASAFVTYNWGTNTSVTLLSNPSTNTTYWIKSVHSGTTRTYYISTNGESYSQVVSFSDSGLLVDFDTPSVIGNCSLVRLQDERPYTGTIDLNGCYIEVDGQVVWQGMGHNDIQRIGGDEFDGQWIYTNQTIGSGATLAVGDTITWSMASYLPDSIYDYEVLLEIGFQTSKTSGDWCEMLVYQNSTASDPAIRVGRCRTRASAIQTSSNTIVIPIYASNQNITFKNHNGAGSAASLGAWARGYRRIGKNGTSNNYISNINSSNTHTIGGKFLNGNWVGISHTIFSGTLASGAGTSVNISSYLPKDGYRYECMFGITAYTGTTSGNSVAVRIGQDSTYGNNPIACRHFTRTSSYMRNAGGMICMLDNRTVYISNAGNATSGKITVYLRGYRRVGTNA